MQKSKEKKSMQGRIDMAANFEIKKLKSNLVTVLNQTPLPIEVKRLVLYEVYAETKQLSDMQIMKEENEVTADGNE